MCNWKEECAKKPGIFKAPRRIAFVPEIHKNQVVKRSMQEIHRLYGRATGKEKEPVLCRLFFFAVGKTYLPVRAIWR